MCEHTFTIARYNEETLEQEAVWCMDCGAILSLDDDEPDEPDAL